MAICYISFNSFWGYGTAKHLLNINSNKLFTESQGVRKPNKLAHGISDKLTKIANEMPTMNLGIFRLEIQSILKEILSHSSILVHENMQALVLFSVIENHYYETQAF